MVMHLTTALHERHQSTTCSTLGGLLALTVTEYCSNPLWVPIDTPQSRRVWGAPQYKPLHGIDSFVCPDTVLAHGAVSSCYRNEPVVGGKSVLQRCIRQCVSHSHCQARRWGGHRRAVGQQRAGRRHRPTTSLLSDDDGSRLRREAG